MAIEVQESFTDVSHKGYRDYQCKVIDTGNNTALWESTLQPMITSGGRNSVVRIAEKFRLDYLKQFPLYDIGNLVNEAAR